ncbi:MAG: N-formylglutamate amidohydrolase [Bacteroidota bacterium]
MPWMITCEHAGNEIPEEYKYLFSAHQQVLETHRGWDLGASEMAEYLAKELRAPLFQCSISRLLIEANRSLHNHQLFSEFSHPLSAAEKQKIIETIYLPYRNPVEDHVGAQAQQVTHLSIHSFTPVWHNKERLVDVGILFDPEREVELRFSESLKSQLSGLLPGYRILFNEPYAGKDDGFATYLRTRFPGEKYIGIELEINQKYVGQPAMQTIQRALVQGVKNLS